MSKTGASTLRQPFWSALCSVVYIVHYCRASCAPQTGATRRFFYHTRTPALIALGLRQKSLVSALFVVVIKELEGMPPKTFYEICGHGAGFQNLTNSNQATLDLGTGASPNYVPIK